MIPLLWLLTILIPVPLISGCASHGEPVGGGSTGGVVTSWTDKDGWFCFDAKGNKWPSNGECD